MRLTNIALITAAALSVGVQLGALAIPASQNGLYQRGLEYFNIGRYDYAARALSAAVTHSPSDPLVHYYLANALVHLNRHAEAQEEYAWSYRLNPRSSVAAYCKLALSTYNGQVEMVPPPVEAAREKVPERAEKAISTIHGQADDEKARMQQRIDAQGKFEIQKGEEECRMIEDRAQQEIYLVMNPPPRGLYQTYDWSLYDPETQQRKIQAIKQKSESDKTEARNRALARSDQHKRKFSDQAAMMDELVGNLESQIKSNLKNGGTRLHPEGTGLYVRCYEMPKGHAPIPSAHTGVVRFVPKGTIDNSPTKPAAEPQKEESSKGFVSGTIVTGG